MDTDPYLASSYIKDMQEAQGRIIAVAEQRLRQRDEKHMQSRKGKEPVHKIGEYVLAEHRSNALRHGPKSKLAPFLKGPLLVVKKLPDGMYTLRDLLTMRNKDYHVSTLRPYLYDERTLKPIEVAATDTFDEFIIEEVLAIKGDIRGKRDKLKFLVKWAGYGEEDNSEISWSSGQPNTTVQTWLYNHPNPRVRKLVTKGFDPNNLDDGAAFDQDSDDELDSGSTKTVLPPPKKKKP